jgi:predicted RNase H-like HicB family nuclease
MLNMEKQIMDFNVFIEQDEDGIYVAKVPELDGCYTQGKTLEEVIERIREAIEVCLEADKEEVNPMRFVGMQKVSIERSQLV